MCTLTSTENILNFRWLDLCPYQWSCGSGYQRSDLNNSPSNRTLLRRPLNQMRELTRTAPSCQRWRDWCDTRYAFALKKGPMRCALHFYVRDEEADNESWCDGHMMTNIFKRVDLLLCRLQFSNYPRILLLSFPEVTWIFKLNCWVLAFKSVTQFILCDISVIKQQGNTCTD